jgi:hypothetical protein
LEGLKWTKKEKKIIINSLIHQRNIKQLRLSVKHVSRMGFALLFVTATCSQECWKKKQTNMQNIKKTSLQTPE